ncbi:hypothetical protein MIMGU_mgv1a009293mg [Erythranthe guttata]|uniref:TF-B3 domain-containing protein n=3 Tax=Erythranthe guttata TaxID=4155 RepID=A0A022PZ15_ERYGU|nr:hypothetical protein MIMGU_mgv1a009293mg [Erythranthe guttata]
MSGRSGFNYEERSSSSSSSGFPLNYCSYGGGGGGGGAPPEFNNYGNGGEEEYSGGNHTAVAAMVEREHMFDKVVTPSDVGKLNRLVIPKQYAEKYFPLDSSNNEKGLLLNFEDRNGKQWRFRYSYWNSSQSYVMTKGWSRFVKDKKLDAGDTVTFQRGLGDFGKDRLFINWRRRPDAPPPPVSSSSSIIFPHSHFSFHSAYSPSNYSNWNSSNPLFYQQSPNNYPGIVNGNPCPRPGSIMYLQRPGSFSPGGGWAAAAQPHTEAQRGGMVFDSVPVVQVANNSNNNSNGSGAAKRMRLFGVTMDCPISEATADSEIIIHPDFDSLNYSNNYHNNYKGKDSLSLDLDL